MSKKTTGLPTEPPDGSAVRDGEGDVWRRMGDYWYLAGEADDDRGGEHTWAEVAAYLPVRLLVEGPVLT